MVRNADVSQLREAAVRNSRLLMKYGQRCANICSLSGASGGSNTSSKAKNPALVKPAQPAKDKLDTPQSRYFVTSDKYEVRESRAVCAKYGAILPELRTCADKDIVQQLAKDNQVQFIMAGIHFHVQDSRFRYNSDHYRAEAPIPFTTFEYGGDYNGKHHKDTHVQGYYMTKYGKTYPLGYAWPNDNFLVRVLDDDFL